MLRIFLQLLQLLWQVLSTGVRVFAFDNVRDGLIDMRPLPRSTRVLIVTSLILILLFLAGMLVSDAIRVMLPIAPLAIASTTERGLLVPTAVVPITLIALILAWSMILAGAVRMHPVARWIAVAIFILFGSQSLGSTVTAAAGLAFSQPMMGVALTFMGGAGFVFIIVAMAALPRLRIPDWAVFVVMLGLVTLYAMPPVIAYSIAAGSAFQAPMRLADAIADGLTITVALLTPFRMISGLEMANLAASLSGWTMQAVQRHAPRGYIVAGLFVVVTARLAGHLVDLFNQASVPWRALAGAVVHLLGIGVLFMAYRRRRTHETASFGIVVVGILAFLSLNVLLIPIMQAGGAAFILIGTATGRFQDVVETSNAVFTALGDASTFYSQYAPLILAVGCAIAAALIRRRSSAHETLLAALAWTALTRWATAPYQPLNLLQWQPEHTNFLTTLVVLLSALALQVSRRLDAQTALRLLGIVVLFALLEQNSFLDNPLSPIAAAAGVLVLVIGIAWNIITSGGRFLNADSPSFPRVARALSYFGYVILTVAAAHWFVSTHTVWQQTLQTSTNQMGFEVFGYAVVWMLCINGGLAFVTPSTSR